MRILVADDDDMVRLVIRELLVCKGCTLEEARDGHEAVRKAQSAFDLIFLDHHMPGMNGTEAALMIRTAHPKARIILLTGSARKEELLPIDGVQVLRKPFAASELLSVL